MSAKNKHSCTCKHESVEYCPTCKVVHCLNCKIEWTQRGFTTWTYPSYGTYYGNATNTFGVTGTSSSFYNTSGMTPGMIKGQGSGAGIFGGVSEIPTETLDALCKHDK